MFASIAACVPIAVAQAPAESHAKLELIAEDSSQMPGKPQWIGILFQLDPGWHIYWQNAGDSGEPPKIQWALPPGFKAGSIRWPTPVRLGSGSVVDYGYEGQVLLMVPIDGPITSASKPLPNISADIKFVVCREICVPARAHLTLSVPDRSDASPWRELFARTRVALPKPLPATWQAHATSDRNFFYLRVQGGSRERAATLFPNVPGQIENSAPQKFESLPDGFRLTLKKSDQLVTPVRWLTGVLVLGDGKAYEIASRVQM